MITLYRSDETDFSHNGLGILNEATSCIVERELNGDWSMKLEYPINSKKAKRIEQFCIIKASTPSGEQLFRIYETEKTFNSVLAYCTHIAIYDLSKNFIRDTNIVGQTRSKAIEQLLDRTLYTHKFKYTGTDTNNKQNNSRIVRKNVITALIGDDDNSIVNRWGGEIDFDNFNILSADEIGSKKGLEIRYAKNMTGITENIDLSELATVIVPQGYDGLLLPEYYIESPLVKNYYQPIVSHVEFDDIKVVEPQQDENGDITNKDEVVTEVQAHNMLRNRVKALFDAGIDKPSASYEISFIDLGNTKEYSNYKKFHSLNIGDTVTVKHEDLGINLDCRIRHYTYDAIKEEFDILQVGTIISSASLTIKEVSAKVNIVKENITLEVSSLDNKLNSKIEITEKGILSEVNNVKDGLNSTITQTAGQIRQEISDVNKNLGTQITQTTEAFNILAGKYNNGELVGTNYRFDGNAFTIGATDGSTTATHTPGYSEWRHGNSVSRADANGFSRDGHPYTHLIAGGTLITGGSFGVFPPRETVFLGDIWKGKNFQVLVSMVDTAGGITDEVVKRTYLRVENIDHANATFTVRGYWTAVDGRGNENEKELEFNWLAIGG